MSRKNKTDYYLDIAVQVADRSTCLRKRFGAVVVKDDVIVSTGYNGAPRGRKNCCDLGTCLREKLNIPRGERYELCRSVHAEANALLQCDREAMKGATLYLVGVLPDGSYVSSAEPCSMCKRLIINSGVSQVITRESDGEYKFHRIEEWVDAEDVLEGKLGY